MFIISIPYNRSLYRYHNGVLSTPCSQSTFAVVKKLYFRYFGVVNALVQSLTTSKKSPCENTSNSIEIRKNRLKYFNFSPSFSHFVAIVLLHIKLSGSKSLHSAILRSCYRLSCCYHLSFVLSASCFPSFVLSALCYPSFVLSALSYPSFVPSALSSSLFHGSVSTLPIYSTSLVLIKVCKTTKAEQCKFLWVT